MPVVSVSLKLPEVGAGRTHKAKLLEAPSYAINPAKTPVSQRFNFHLLPVDVGGVHQTWGKIQSGQMFLTNANGGQNPKWDKGEVCCGCPGRFKVATNG